MFNYKTYSIVTRTPRGFWSVLLVGTKDYGRTVIHIPGWFKAFVIADSFSHLSAEEMEEFDLDFLFDGELDA